MYSKKQMASPFTISIYVNDSTNAEQIAANEFALADIKPYTK
jgi:hypothetical protein